MHEISTAPSDPIPGHHPTVGSHVARSPSVVKRCTQRHPEDTTLHCTLPDGHDGMHTILPSSSLWDALSDHPPCITYMTCPYHDGRCELAQRCTGEDETMG